jgi:hypothetical protein
MGAKRYPWDEILAFWVALGPERSYRKVSLKFGVSEQAVKRHARANHWAELGEEADAKARQAACERGTRTLTERIVETHALIDDARASYAAALREGHVPTDQGLVALLKLELLYEERATDRVEHIAWREAAEIPSEELGRELEALRAVSRMLTDPEPEDLLPGAARSSIARSSAPLSDGADAGE